MTRNLALSWATGSSVSIHPDEYEIVPLNDYVSA